MSWIGDPGLSVTIHRLIDLEVVGRDSVALIAGIERIFRSAAAHWPDDPVAARAFQELWLSQYLVYERELVFIAKSGGVVVGYLVGCRINPATSPRFATLGYFQTFAAYCVDYPAHLHINLDADFRGHGIGERLINALFSQLRADGVIGIHVVTGREQRNVGFYRRLGFDELVATPRGGGEVLFLGRRLGSGY